MYIFGHTFNSVESNFRLNCNFFMSNVTFLHWLGRGRHGHCPFHIIGQFSMVCIIIMTFDVDLFITITSEMHFLSLNYMDMWHWRFVYVHWFKITIWHYSPLIIMLIMLIMLIKNVAPSCRLGKKAEFVHWPIGNMNQSENLTLLTISRFYGRQLDYKIW